MCRKLTEEEDLKYSKILSLICFWVLGVGLFVWGYSLTDFKLSIATMLVGTACFILFSSFLKNIEITQTVIKHIDNKQRGHK